MTNQQTSNQQNSNQDHRKHADNDLMDISLIGQAIFHSWKLIISFTLFSILIGLGLASVLPKEWEAKATLNVGHIQTIQPNGGTESKLIEDPVQTVERMKIMGFKKKVLANLGLPLEEGIDHKSDLFINSLKANAILNTDFFTITVRGYSAIDASNNMNATVKEIQKTHLLMAQPQRNKLLNQLKANTESLTSTSIDLINLKNKVAIADTRKSNSDFAPSIVVINLLTSTEADFRLLQNQQIQYSSLLTAMDEQATSIVDTVQISRKPVFPKRNIFLLFGALFGFLSGTAIAVWKYKKG